MDDREPLQQTLTMARAVLAVLEQQAAGFGALHIPAHLKIELEEKRKEVASLEARLSQLEGRRPATLPDNLPRRPEIFVGREEEVRRCLGALSPDERGWGVTIDGIGGIGKTALALEVAHQAKEQAGFDAYLFASAKTSRLTADGVRAETLALTPLDAFIREFALGLGERGVAEIPDATERRRALLEALRGRRALLIWDNLETLTKDERDGISEFLRRLPGVNKAIITSRRRTGESALTLRLDRLSEEAAFGLMDKLAHRNARVRAELRHAGIELRRALYEASGGNPLALHWILGLVSQKGYTLTAALDRLRDAARSQDLYGFLFADAARDLAETDRKTLTALAYFHTPASQAALADATKLVQTEVEVALERLVTLSLVNDLAGGRYGLHPLTRTYVRAALGEGSQVTRAILDEVALDPQARRNALRHWVDYAREYGGDAYRTFDRLEAEWPNLEAAATELRDIGRAARSLRDEQAARMLNDLADALRTFLWFRGYWEERVRLSDWAYRAMAALDDWPNAGWRAYDVAWIHYNRAETDQASAWADRMAEAMEQGGTRRDQAAATRMRGTVAEQRGDLDEAQRLYTEALAAYRDLGEEADQASVLNDLGGVARGRKDYDRAEGYYGQALAIDEKRGDKEGQATRSSNLGLLALDRGRPAEAREWYERALHLAQQVGRQDLVADAQWGLARVLEEQGRFAEALALAEAALEIYERLRHRDLELTRGLVARLREKV
jgi:tetratricopeptide (TPR) repeat protein